MKTPSIASAGNLVCWAFMAWAPLASAQSVDQLTPHKVKLESVNYLGKQAVKITEDGVVVNGEAYAVVTDSVFHDGSTQYSAHRSQVRIGRARTAASLT